MAVKLTFAKLVKQFLAWAGEALATRTAEAYEWQLARAVKQLGSKPIGSLRPADLTRWAKTWHEWQAVTRVCNWAVHEAGILKRSPFAAVKPPPRRERQRIMSPREMARLLRRCSSAARAFVLAMRETFARPQEIRAA
jgi:integrase